MLFIVRKENALAAPSLQRKHGVAECVLTKCSPPPPTASSTYAPCQTSLAFLISFQLCVLFILRGDAGAASRPQGRGARAVRAGERAGATLIKVRKYAHELTLQRRIGVEVRPKHRLMFGNIG